jgi:anti-sigma B factor antagonist
MPLSITRERDAQTVVRLRGALDVCSIQELTTAIGDLASLPRAEIIVDVTALRLIDSAGVRVLLSLHKRVRATGGSFRVVGLSGQPLAMLRLLRMDGVLSRVSAEIVHDAPCAIAAA